MSIIQLKNVSKYYNNNGNITVALRNINLSFERGEIVAITGDSGSGKSTLLNVISGVDTYEDGEMYFDGNETSYFNQNDLDNYRKSKIGFIFQNYNIIESYSVLENVMVPMLINGVSNEEAKARALEIIEKVNLSHRINNKGTKLSGGEKQRCVIARALASDCEILACDEPTGNLDSKTGDEIIELIKEVAKDKLVLIVTHNFNQVKDIVTRTIKISDGEVLEDNYVSNHNPVSIDESATKKDKLKTSVLFKFAIKNLINTPKKTIFTFAVLLSISVISIILMMSVLQYSYENGYSSYSPYPITIDEHLIVYDKDHKEIDPKIIDECGAEVINYNAFYEMSFIQARVKRGKYIGLFSVYYAPYNFSKHQYGRLPEKDGEYYFIVPDTTAAADVSYYYTSELTLICNNRSLKGTVVGSGVSDAITEPCIFSYTDISDILSEEVNPSLFNAVYYNSDTNSYIDIHSNISTGQSMIRVSSAIVQNPEDLDYKFILGSLYESNYEINVVVYESTSPDIRLYMNKTSFKPSLDGIYEASIYASNPDKVVKYLEANGYSVTITTRMFEEDSVATLIAFYTFSILVAISIVALSFITYLILYKVYASRNKDYTVLRSLGIVRSKMKIIVIFETIIMTLVSTIVAFMILLSIYYFSGKTLLVMMEFSNVLTILISLAIMALFGYFLANKYNNKLFKFSVSTSLKSEVEA